MYSAAWLVRKGLSYARARFSEDGVTQGGLVPGTLLPSTFYVTVHEGEPLLNIPMFGALLFVVT